MLIGWTFAVFVAAMLPLTPLAVGSNDCLLQENIVQSEQEEAACMKSYDNWSSGVIAVFFVMWASVGLVILRMRTGRDEHSE
ncbi:hypothetical protein [Sphingopyxis sp. PET50]|uniref:hypothetical protein n=1 Tax=Sphingopyxis sp. PET50 TaxID=2976533 RepID=UPI0021AEF446|nr:hypothetical protein [Sphingopyxis sp. PET50]